MNVTPPIPDFLKLTLCDDGLVHVFACSSAEEDVGSQAICGKTVSVVRLPNNEDFVCEGCDGVIDDWHVLDAAAATGAN